VSYAGDPSDVGAKAELLDLLLNATHDGIVDWNVVSGETVYNPRWKHLLGFDEAEHAAYCDLPDAWRDLMHHEDRPHVLKLIDDHLEQSWPLYTTLRMRHRYGGYRHVLLRGAARRDANDKPVRMVLIFSDIDERIRGEEQQRALVSALSEQRGLQERPLQSPNLGTSGPLVAGVADEIHTSMQSIGDDLRIARAAITDTLSLVDLLRGTLESATQAPLAEAKRSEIAQREIELDFERLREALPKAIERSLTGVERVSNIVRATKTFAHPDGDAADPSKGGFAP
jgi:PAS domain S-box-containing protein